MRKNDVLHDAVSSYRNAKAEKKEAIQAVFEEIALTLEKAGYITKIVNRGRGDLSSLDIHLSFPEGLVIVLSSSVRDIDPFPESLDQAESDNPIDLHKAEVRQE